MDPELGVNIVDLGLIYDLGWDDENDALVIHMTLTSAGCPLTDVLEEQTGRGARRHRRRVPHQLGVDAAVGPRAHHRRRARHDARPRVRDLADHDRPRRASSGPIDGSRPSSARIDSPRVA